MLVIRPSIEEDDIRALKQSARRQAFARGQVIPGADGLVFESSTGDSELLEQDLKRYFSKKVSALQNARVTTRSGTPPRKTRLQGLHTQGDFLLAE